MKILKKILTIFTVIITIGTIFVCFNIQTSSMSTRKLVNVGVLSYDFKNVFSSLIGKSLQDIQNENSDKVRFTFYDGQSNPAIESENLDKIINGKYDLILASLFDKNEPEIIEEAIFKAKQKNIPIIFFNVSPAKLEVIRNYNKSLIINIDQKEAGTLQGNIISEYWDKNKEIVDKNHDDIMQYILLKGEPKSILSEERAKYPILAINKHGIKTQELGAANCNWDKDTARNAMEALFLRNGNKIEVVIASNDSMAIGATEALQKYGYNMGDKENNIPVFGINGTDEVKELIKKGIVAGSAPQNPRAMADALYSVGMNLVDNKDLVEGTKYKFDDSGVIIPVKYEEYPKK